LERWVKLALALIALSLAVLIPFASMFPDGLERAVKTLGVEEAGSLLNAIFHDYAVGFIENSYLSTLIAGLVGFFAVFAITWTIGKALKHRKTKNETRGNIT